MTIEIRDAIKIVNSYKKYSSDETRAAIEGIIRELVYRDMDEMDGLVKQYEEVK